MSPVTPFVIVKRTPADNFVMAPSYAANQSEINLPIRIDKDCRIGVAVGATAGETINLAIEIWGWEYAVEH